MSGKCCIERERVKFYIGKKESFVIIVIGVLLCVVIICSGVLLLWNYLIGSSSNLVIARIPSKLKSENVETFVYWIFGLTPFVALVIFLLRDPVEKMDESSLALLKMDEKLMKLTQTLDKSIKKIAVIDELDSKKSN